jgi:hypothetical protein
MVVPVASIVSVDAVAAPDCSEFGGLIWLVRTHRSGLARHRKGRYPTRSSRGVRRSWQGRHGRVNRTDAVVSFEQAGELLSVLGCEAENHPGLTPRLLKRIAHVTGDRRHWISGQTMHDSPSMPRAFKRCRR